MTIRIVNAISVKKMDTKSLINEKSLCSYTLQYSKEKYEEKKINNDKNWIN